MALCEMCGQGWCGRPCINDPHKSNGLLFHRDGRLKTLKERGLAWDSPPLKPAAQAPRPKPRLAVLKLKELAGTKPQPGTKPQERNPPGTKPHGGRPKIGEKAMTAAERKRRWLEKRKDKP